MHTATATGPTLDALIAGVRSGDRAMLARAITLVESTKAEHQGAGTATAAGPAPGNGMQGLLPATGTALRLGITGVPGVGKSTTIDELGMNLAGLGHKVAVLAVDPTSKRTGGIDPRRQDAHEPPVAGTAGVHQAPRRHRARSAA